MPWDFDYSGEEYDGLFLTNGPGDPKMCRSAIDHIRKSLDDVPVFGICLGNQLMALAAGADTYKLRYGHRSHNQPVQMVGTDRAYITSQNHGFAVNNNTLPAGWEPLFVNVNDNTNEGMEHVTEALLLNPVSSRGLRRTDGYGFSVRSCLLTTLPMEQAIGSRQ